MDLAGNSNAALGAIKALHDIRSPLGALRILLARMKSEKAEQDLLVNIIDRIEAIAKELKNLNTAVGGYRPLGVIIDHVIAEALLVMDGRCVIQCDIEPSVRNQLMASSPLSRALINLINNSFEAGAMEIQIQIRTENGKIVMKVYDDGEGIPAKTLRLIREGKRCSLKHLGCGLGLGQVFDFAQNHDGAVAIQSDSKHGTEITVVWQLTNGNG